MSIKSDVILCYITFDTIARAKAVGKHLLDRRVAACVNIFPKMKPVFFWPPQENIIDESSEEVVLIAKTIESKYLELEKQVIKLHIYDTPCIIAIPTSHVSKKYYDWLISELNYEPWMKK